MKLNEIGIPEGRRARKTKRRGRGDCSGHGGTSCRGHKGQRSRAGGFHKLGFEGGQMPLQRRLPKTGFFNKFRVKIAVVNLDALSKLPKADVVDEQYIRKHGLVKGKSVCGIKVLGNGTLTAPINLRVTSVSETAKKKIEAAGGKVEVVRG